MPVPFVSGWVRLTSSGVVGDSGKAQWISGYTFESSGTAGIPYFRNGTGVASDNIVFRGGGGVVNGGSQMQAVGQLPTAFANGCYVSFDANTTAVTVFYVQA
jgi:hypothetical protein